jgi:uncharacterized protein (TIGR04222 family)
VLIRHASAGGRKWELDPYEVAYLAGGSARAADVAIAELTHSGALRVDSRGRLSMADPAAAAASLASTRYGIVPARLPDGLRTVTTRLYLRKSPGIAAIGGRLRAAGLMMSGRRAATPPLVMVILAAALLVTGALRIHEGVTNHRPVGNLSALVFVTVVIALFFSVILSVLSRTTTLGRACLRDLRQARSSGAFASPAGAGPAYPGSAYPASGLASGLAAPLGGAMMFGVALAGFAAVEDPGLRSALFAGLPAASSGSSSGSSCGSSSSCGGGGSSCGGGGCGGGGCGGGGCGG